MRKHLVQIALAMLIATLLIAPYIARAQTENVTAVDFIASALSNPRAFVAIAIQFLMGLALGYISIKILKYILALIAILILGSILSIWSIGGSVEEFIGKVTTEAYKVWPIISGALMALGILTIAPVTAGFILGVIIGFIRK